MYGSPRYVMRHSFSLRRFPDCRFDCCSLVLSTFDGDSQRTATPYCIHKTCRFDDIADSNAVQWWSRDKSKAKVCALAECMSPKGAECGHGKNDARTKCRSWRKHNFKLHLCLMVQSYTIIHVLTYPPIRHMANANRLTNSVCIRTNFDSAVCISEIDKRMNR